MSLTRTPIGTPMGFHQNFIFAIVLHCPTDFLDAASSEKCFEEDADEDECHERVPEGAFRRSSLLSSAVSLAAVAAARCCCCCRCSSAICRPKIAARTGERRSPRRLSSARVIAAKRYRACTVKSATRCSCGHSFEMWRLLGLQAVVIPTIQDLPRCTLACDG